jgi:transposase
MPPGIIAYVLKFVRTYVGTFVSTHVMRWVPGQILTVIAGYRSQSEAEFSFRQLKDPHVVSFSPMHHWTEHNIRVHVFTCVLALQIAHLMRRTADQAGLHLSVRQLLVRCPETSGQSIH